MYIEAKVLKKKKYVLISYLNLVKIVVFEVRLKG